MFEIEKMDQEFDYSIVDNETADFLRSCEYEMNGIAEDARVKFGGVLIKAQGELANHYKGVFKEWVVSGGVSVDDAYYYINLNRSSRNLNDSKRSNFLNAPKTLQKEVMKSNAPEELKEQVLSGDITTNKEYQDLKRRLKESEEHTKRQASMTEAERKERERLESEIGELAKQSDVSEAKRKATELELQRAVTPEVEIREVVKEVVPTSVKQRISEIEKEKDEMSTSLSKAYSRLRELEKIEQAVKTQAESPLYDMHRSLRSLENYLQVFTEDEKLAEGIVSNSDRSTIDNVLGTLNRVMTHANHAKGLLEGETITIINAK